MSGNRKEVRVGGNKEQHSEFSLPRGDCTLYKAKAKWYEII